MAPISGDGGADADCSAWISGLLLWCGCCGKGLRCTLEVFVGRGLAVLRSYCMVFSRGGTPLLPGGKPFGCFRLAVVVVAKFGQIKGLWIKCEAPGGCRGLFLSFYFNYSGWRGSNVPTLFPFV